MLRPRTANSTDASSAEPAQPTTSPRMKYAITVRLPVRRALRDQPARREKPRVQEREQVQVRAQAQVWAFPQAYPQAARPVRRAVP